MPLWVLSCAYSEEAHFAFCMHPRVLSFSIKMEPFNKFL